FFANVLDADNLVSFIQLQQNTISRLKFSDPVNLSGLDGKVTGCSILRLQCKHILRSLTNGTDHIAMTLAHCGAGTLKTSSLNLSDPLNFREFKGKVTGSPFLRFQCKPIFCSLTNGTNPIAMIF